MKKVYIAGKVTGLPQHEVVEKFKKAKHELNQKGFFVVNPIEVVGDWETPWNTAMKLCINALIECDAVVLLPCWPHSKGAQIECGLAIELEIPTFEYESELEQLNNFRNA